MGRSNCAIGRHTQLLFSIESRIASLVGMPLHSEENTPVFARQFPGTARCEVQGVLHHDKNSFETRRATVLLFLANMTDDAAGGHLLFPGIHHDESPTTTTTTAAATTTAQADVVDAEEQDPNNSTVPSMTPEEVSRRLTAAFDRGERQLGDQRCQSERVRHAERYEDLSVDAGLQEHGVWDVPLFRHVEAECRRARRGVGDALRIRPTAGTALVFWHELPDGRADPRVWHAACNGQITQERWTMQKFKAPPSS